MKILTICIPVEENTLYLEEAISSCLLQKEDIEIVVVAKTKLPILRIAEKYQQKYPESIKVIVLDEVPLLQLALEQTTGLYFKVLDGNDSFDTSVLVKVIQTIKDLLRIQANLDMMICDYQFSKIAKNKDKILYEKVFPMDHVFQWHQIKPFSDTKVLNFKSVIFKSSIMKCSDIPYIESAYMEELFNLYAMKNSISMYYLNQSLQYVNTHHQDEISEQQIDECVAMTKQMLHTMDIASIDSRKLRKTMMHHITQMLLRSTSYLLSRNTAEAREEKRNLYLDLQGTNYIIYKYMRKSPLMKLVLKDTKAADRLFMVRYKNKY